MDFSDTREEAQFRAEVKTWLRDNAPTSLPGGVPRNRMGLTAEQERAALDAAKRWQAKKFDSGYAAITWPEEYGGRAGKPIEQVIYNQEEAHYPAAADAYFSLASAISLPGILRFGTPRQKTRYIRPGLRGEHVWCHLMSEPGAGSDAAAMRTRAVREGDEWIVNGQKIWTSNGHFADYGTLFARTDATVPKHKGLTAFILDLKSPGVTIRPIRQITGRSEFNEVFFENVPIAHSEMLGEERHGWQVLIAELMMERQDLVGGGLGFVDYPYLIGLASHTTLGGHRSIDDHRVRERIAEMYINSQALRLIGLRAQTALSKGEPPGPELSINKAVVASQGQQAAYIAMDMMDQAGLLTKDELGDDWLVVERSWMWGAAMRIAGGTDEILRNIIGERILGLPEEPRVDKAIPFNQLDH